MKHSSLLRLSGLILFILGLFPATLISEETNLSLTGYTVTKSSYNINVKDNLTEAAASFSLDISVHNDQWCEIRIASLHYQVSLSKLPAETILTKDNRYHKLIFRKAGQYRLEGAISLAVNQEDILHKLTIPIVPATFSSVEVAIPNTNLGIIIQPDSSYEKKEKGKSTLITFSLPLTDETTVIWGPKEAIEQRSKEVSVNTTSDSTIEKGLLTTVSSLEFSIANQSLKNFSLLLPEKTTLLEVKGRNLDRWFIEKMPEGKILNVFLQKSISEGVYSFQIISETPLEFDKPFQMQPFRLLNIPKQSGILLFTIVKDLNLTIEKTKDLQQIDTKSSPRPAGIGYRWENQSAELVFSVSRKEPRLDAQVEMIHILKSYFITTYVKSIWDIKNIGVDALTLSIPEKFSVISVAGQEVRTYHFNDRQLKIFLKKPVLGKVNFLVELQRPYQPDETLILQPIVPDEAVGFESAVAIKPDNLETKIVSVREINQISPKQLPDWFKNHSPAFAFQSKQDNWQIEVKSEILKPEISAAVYEYLHLSENILNREMHLKLSVKKTPLFSLDLSVPDDFTPTEVNSSDLKGWAYDDRSHLLKLTFPDGIKDEHHLKITLNKKIEEQSKLTISSFRFITPAKAVATYVMFSAAQSIILKLTEPIDNISEISVSKLPPEITLNRSALKMTLSSFSPQWSFNLLTTLEPTRLTAKISSALTVRPGQMKVFNLVNYSVQGNRETNRFLVKLPPGAINPEIQGEDIKNLESKGDVWEIKLRRKVSSYRLSVIYEKVEPEFSPLELIDTLLESGTLIIAPGNPRDEVTIGEKENLQVSNTTEIKILPDLLAGLSAPPVAFITYTSEKARLKLSVKTHELNQTLQAKILDSHLYSRLHDNGELITYFQMEIENKGKQNLTMRLPRETIFWGAYLNNKPVKPTSKDTGEMLIPLMPEQKTDGQLLSLLVIYIQDIKKLGKTNNISLTMPATDLSINNAVWHLFLPSGHYLTSNSGNMELVLKDPDLVYPSLVKIISRSIISFIKKVWLAIPPVVKDVVFYILITLIMISGLLFIIKIIQSMMTRLNFKVKQTLKWATAGVVTTIFFLGLLSMLMPSLQSRKIARESFSGSVRSQWAPSPVSEVDKSRTELPYLQKDMGLNDVITAEPVWEDAKPSDHNESAANELSLGNIAKKESELYGRAQSQLRRQNKLDELKKMEKQVESYDQAGIRGRKDSDDRKGGYLYQEEMFPTLQNSPILSEPLSASKPSAPSGEKTPDTIRVENEGNAENRFVTGIQTFGSGGGGQITSAYDSSTLQLKTPDLPQVFSKTKQGRTKGALAIPVSLPLHQTDYYRFQSTYLGETVANVSVNTFSGSMILFLQLIVCLAISIFVSFLIYRYNPLSAIIGLAGLTVLSFIVPTLVSGLADEFFRTAGWFSLVLLVLIALLLRRKIAHRTSYY
ncbi:MAG: hypothetical protein AAB019_12560 [Planctomycetota bacterium]